jgi:hypothetical protein
LLFLQAGKYLIPHSTGTVTIARAMMGRQKKEGNQEFYRDDTGYGQQNVQK